MSAAAPAAAQTGPPAGPAPLSAAAAQAAPAGLDLTLDEAVALALEHNLDIAVERLNPQTFDLAIAGVRALYRPVLTSVVGQNNVTQIPTNQLIGTQAVQNDQTTFNVGGSQLLRWGGGNLALGFNNRRQDSTSSFNTFNPQYNTTFSALFVQPLLRNFRTDPTRTQLRITAINRDIERAAAARRRSPTRSPTSATPTGTTSTPSSSCRWRGARWSWRASCSRTTASASRSARWRRSTSCRPRPRSPRGCQEEAQGEAQSRTAELSLKRLIVGGTDDPRWRARIRPVDRPAFTPAPIDLDAALRHALDARLDLARDARSSSQPTTCRCSCSATSACRRPISRRATGSRASAATRLIRDGNLGGEILTTIPGGYTDALRLLRDRDFPQWNVALTLSYPIGASLADASYARAQITVRQTAGADPRPRAADRHRRHQRGAARREQPEAGRRGARPPASWRSGGSRPSRASSRSACRPTSSSCRRSATWPRPRTSSCGPASTTRNRSSTSTASRKRRCGSAGISLVTAPGSTTTRLAGRPPPRHRPASDRCALRRRRHEEGSSPPSSSVLGRRRPRLAASGDGSAETGAAAAGSAARLARPTARPSSSRPRRARADGATWSPSSAT